MNVEQFKTRWPYRRIVTIKHEKTMNKEKKLIYTDTSRGNFERYIYQTIERANQLIDAWHSFQPRNIIQTYDQAIELIKDPGEAMDRLLLSAVDIKVIGSSK